MIYYIRDEKVNLEGMKYNNDLYYYIKNLQNDIIGLIDSNNNVVATYEYDSYGNIISIKDSLGVEFDLHFGVGRYIKIGWGIGNFAGDD